MIMKHNITLVLAAMLSALLIGCHGLFDKDNTPPPAKLTPYTAEIQVKPLWTTRTGSGAGKDYLKFPAAVNDTTVFTADKNGTVTATDKITGKKIWSKRASEHLSAGPTTGEGLVVVCSNVGEVTALDTTTGDVRWRANTHSEVLAKPAIHHHTVVIKSIDGKLSTFAAEDGHVLWQYQQNEPALILRGASAPQIDDDHVIAGFANGSLIKLTLAGGNLLWKSTIAIPEGGFAIERMIDIDADPLIDSHRVFVATYQGRIAALDLQTGREAWMQDISSYTGMTVDGETVYLSDAKSHLWAFDKQNGKVNWRQSTLEYRNISAPVKMDNTIVVGDSEGYLHWLHPSDGHIMARTRVNKSSILATPVVDNHTLYVVTTDGHLTAYTIL